MRERLLNYSHHLRRLRLMVLVAVLAVPIGAAGQLTDPNDALNLDFKDGLSGWKLYHGVVDLGGSLENNAYYWNLSSAKSKGLTSEGDASDEVGLFSGGFSGEVDENGEVVNYKESSADSYWSNWDIKKKESKGKNENDCRFNIWTRGNSSGTGDDDMNYGKGNTGGGIEDNDCDDCKDDNDKCVSRLSRTNGFEKTCQIGASFGVRSGDACELQRSSKFKTGVTSAEMMEYEFLCTDQMGMLRVDYCAVAMSPGEGLNHHTQAGKPAFYIVAEYYDEKSASWKDLGCGATVKNTDQMVKCDGSPANKDKTLGSTRWESVAFDLTEKDNGSYVCVGKTVRLQVYVNDCCYGSGDISNINKAGGHGCYMYFKASIKPLKLNVNYCKSGDPVLISAPAGYDSYTWYQMSESVIFDEENPSLMEIYKMKGQTSNVLELRTTPSDKRFHVTMKMNGSECPIDLDTIISPTNLEPGMDVRYGCYRGVYLEDASRSKSTSGSGAKDSVVTWKWTLFPAGAIPVVDGQLSPITDEDGKISRIDTDPKTNEFVFKDANGTLVEHQAISINPYIEATLDAEGQYVVLEVETVSGCRSMICKKIVPRFVPVNTVKIDDACLYGEVNGTILTVPANYADWLAVDDAYLKNGIRPTEEQIKAEGFEASDYLAEDYMLYLMQNISYSFDGGDTWLSFYDGSITIESEALEVGPSLFKEFLLRDKWDEVVKDENGNVKKDENGNAIKIERQCVYNVEAKHTVHEIPITVLRARNLAGLKKINDEIILQNSLKIRRTNYQVGICKENTATLYLDCHNKYNLDWSSGDDDDMADAVKKDNMYASKDKVLPGGIHTVTVDNGNCKSQILIDVTEGSSDIKLDVGEPVCAPGPVMATLSGASSSTPTWGMRVKTGKVEDGIAETKDVAIKSGSFVFEQAEADFDSLYYVSGTDDNGCNYNIPFMFEEQPAARPDFTFSFRQTIPNKKNEVIVPNDSKDGAPMSIKYDPATRTYVCTPICGYNAFNDNYINVAVKNPNTGAKNCYLHYTWYKNTGIVPGKEENVWKNDYQVGNQTYNRALYPSASAAVVDEYTLVVTSHTFDDAKTVICEEVYTIKIESLPTPTATFALEADGLGSYESDRACVGSNVTLTAIGVSDKDIVSYTWYDPTKTGNPEVPAEMLKGQANGTLAANAIVYEMTEGGNTYSSGNGLYYFNYGVRVEDSKGCIGAITKAVYVKPLPKFVVPDVVGCPRETDADGNPVGTPTYVTLEAKDLAEGTYSHSYNNIDITKGYSWDGGANFDVSDGGSQKSIALTGEEPKTIRVAAKASNGCVSTVDATVSAYSEFDIVLDAIRPGGNASADVTADADGKFKICAQSKAVNYGLILRVKPRVQGETLSKTFTYKVTRRRDNTTKSSKATAASSRVEVGSFALPTGLSASVETFDVVVTSSDGCVRKAEFKLYVLQRPSLSLSSDRVVACEGDEVGVTIHAEDYSTPLNMIAKMEWVGVDNQTWDGNNLDGKVSYVDGVNYKTYTARVTTTEGCFDTLSINIYNGRKPVFDVVAEPASLCEGSMLETNLIATSDYANTKFYTEGDVLWSKDQVLTPSSSAAYEVSTGAVFSESEKFVVKAASAYIGPNFTHCKNISAIKNTSDVCYATKEVTVTSKPVPVVTVEVLDENQNPANGPICDYSKYYLKVASQLTGATGEMIEVDLDVNGTAMSDPKLEAVPANGNVVIGPFSPVNNSADVVNFSWKVVGGECGGSSKTEVKIAPRPVARILVSGNVRTGADGVYEVCENTQLTLSSAYGADSYSWTSNVGSSSTEATMSVTPVFKEGENNEFYLVVTENGCQSEQTTLKVSVVKSPSFTAWATLDPVCENCLDTIMVSDGNNMQNNYIYKAYTLDANGDRIQASQKVVETEFVKTENLTDENGKVTGTVDRTYYIYKTPFIGQSTVYEIEAEDAGCFSSQKVEVNMSNTPVLELVDAAGTVIANNGVYGPVCKHSTVKLSISNKAPGTRSTTYQLRQVTVGNTREWTEVAKDPYEFSVTPDRTHEYEIRAVSQDGCVAYHRFKIEVKNASTVSTTGNWSFGCNYSRVCSDFDGSLTIKCENASETVKSWRFKDVEDGTISGTDHQAIVLSNISSPNKYSKKEEKVSYEMIVTDKEGCEQPAKHTVYFYPAPEFNVEVESPVCFENSEAKVKVTTSKVLNGGFYDGDNYKFMYGLSDDFTAQTNASKDPVVQDYTFTQVGTDNKLIFDVFACYKASTTGASLYCVSSKKDVEVSVIHKPTFTVVAKKKDGSDIGNAKLCPNEKFILEFNESRSNYSDVVTYTVTDHAGNVVATVDGLFGSKAQTDSIIADRTTTYTVTAVAKKGCSAETSTITVNVERPFSVSIASSKKTSGESNICNGETVTLSAVGLQASELWNGDGDVYEWSTSDKTKDILCAVNDSKSYTVKVKNANGCWSEPATHKVVVHPNPIVSIEEQPSGCAGSDFEVKANATIAEGSIANYKWFSVVTENGPDGMPNTSDDEKKYLYKNEGETFEATFNPSSAMYGVAAYSETYGCSDTMDFKVDVLANPDIVVEVDNIPGVFFEECIGTPMTLVASNKKHSNAETTFRWKKRDGTSVDGANGNSLTVTPNSANEIGLIVEAEVDACVSSKEISYVGKPNPVAVITANVCSGMPGVLNATVNEEGATLVWNGDVSAKEKTYKLENPQAGDVVKLQVTGSNGCITEIEHIVKPVTAPSVTIMGPSGVCLNTNFKLNSTVKMADGVAIRWYKGDGLDANGKAVYGDNPIDQGKDEISQRLTEENKTVYYKVKVTIPDGNGAYCSDSAEFTVTPYPVPSFSVADVKVCAGLSATFDMVGANGTGYAENVSKYVWSDEETNEEYKAFEDTTVSSTSFIVKPNTAKTTSFYRVYGISPEGCETDVKRVKVVVNPNPIVKIKNENSKGFERCSNGDPIALKAEITSGQDAVSYDWGFGPVSVDVAGADVYTFDDMEDRIVRVTVQDNNGCFGEASQLVRVNLAPAVSIVDGADENDQRNSRYYCASDIVTLKAVPGLGVDVNGYAWTRNKTEELKGVTQGSLNIATSDNGDSKFDGKSYYSEVYGVKVTDSKGCTSEESYFTVNVEKRPEVTISKVTPVCPGSETVINLKGAQTYGVLMDNGSEKILVSSEYREVLYANKQFKFRGYNVLTGETGKLCNSDWEGVSAVVKTAPIVSISEAERGENLQGTTVMACENESVELTAKATGGVGNYTYSWSQNAKEANYVQTLSGGSSNIYPFTVEVRDDDGDGCPTKATVTFEATPSPMVSIYADKNAVCDKYEIVSLKACEDAGCSDNTDTDIVYEWQYEMDGEISGGGQAQTATLGQIESDVLVRLTAKRVSTGCVSQEATKTIKRNSTPEFTVYDIEGKDIFDPNYGNVMVCVGQSANLYVQTTDQNALKGAEWTLFGNPDSLLSNLNTFVSPGFVSGSSEANYTVKVQGGNGCYASKNFTIGVKATPNLTLDGPFDPKTGMGVGLCEGTNVVFKASSTSGDKVDFSWTAPLNVKSSKELTYELSGNKVKLQVTATLDGCTTTEAREYNIYENPAIRLDADPAVQATSNSICEGSSVGLYAVVESIGLKNQVVWQWQDENSVPFSNKSEISVSPAKTTKYYLVGTVRYDGVTACKATKEIDITVVGKPQITATFMPSNEVCSNESVTLNLGGAKLYKWNKGSRYDDLNAEQLGGSQLGIGTDFVAGTINEYSIKGYDIQTYPNGATLICEAEVTAGLKVYAAPNVGVSAPSKACPDTEITLIATGADNYSWVGTGKLSDGVTDLNGATSNSISLTPGSNNKTFSYSVIGTEIVDVVTQKVCSTKANVAVEVLPKSKISFGEVDSVCIGDYAVIKATGVSIGGKQPYVDFIWSTGEMGDSISYLITKDSEITVTGRDTNNCFVDETVKIKAQDPAGFNLSLDPSVNTKVCEGSPVTLKVVGAEKYKWEDDPSNTKSEMQVAPVSNTSYTVEGTSGVCTKKLTIPVEIVSAPAISIVGNTVVCRNSTMELQATSQTTGLVFKWEGTDAAGDKLSVVPTIDGEKYIVTATDPNGKYCRASKSVTVTLREEPNVKISGDLTVCENTYGDLNVGGAVSYVWGYEDADGNPVNNVAGGTNYQPKMEGKDLVVFVDGTDSYGCKGSDKVTVSHVAPPSVKINGVDQICAGQAVSLTAGGNAEIYVWNGKDTSASVNEALETSKTYSLKGISTEGCVAEARLLVTVVQNPILSLSGNTTLCQNDMLRVKAHGADTYIWGGGASPDGYPDSMSMKMPDAGIRKVALTGVTGGCSTTQNFEINVKKAPNVQIEGDKETCANVSLPLKAVSEDEITSYTWTNNLNNVSLAGQSVSPVITQDVIYTVKAGNIYGCADTAEFPIRVVSSPNIAVSADIEFGNPNVQTTLEFNDLGVAYVDVCDGSKLNLQVSGGAKTFSWNHKNGVDTSYTSLDTTITSAATFVVTGYMSGCDASRTIVVGHKTNPSIDVIGKRVVCEGSPVTLEPVGTDAFLWNGKEIVPDENGKKVIEFTPVVKNFKYTLVGIDTVNNCQTVRTYTDISFNSKPEFTVSGEKEVCVNESIVLNAFAVDPANDEGNYSYTWGYDKDSKKAFDLDSELEVTAFEAGVDQLFASVKDSVGCVDTLFFEVTKKPLPTLTFNANGSDNDPSTPEIIDICMKNDLYAYINGGGASITQENGKVSSTIKDKPVKDTIYKVTGTLNGCVNTLEIPVRTIPSPIVYLTNYAEDEELTYCEGSPVKLVVGGNAVSYIMPDGKKGTNGSVYVDSTASDLMTYFITGEGANGCSVQEEFTFKMNALPEVAIDIEKDQDRICYREVAELHVTGAESYTWSTGSHKETIKATITKDSLFTVVGKDGNGCEREVSFKVTMVELPVLAYNGDTEFCDGNTATLRGSGTGVGGGDYYAWSIGKDTIAMGNLATTKLNGNTTYTLWGKSKEGCVSSLDVDITAKEAPILFWEGEYELNETADAILLCQKQTLDITMKGADTYQWTGGSTSDRLTVVPTRSTHYTVTGTGANGCKTTQAIYVEVLPTPTIKIEAPTFACVGEDFQMKVTDDTKDKFESFAWSNHSTEATSGDLTMTEEDYTLKVTGYTSLNCPAEASFTVKPKALPKLYVRGTKEICKGGVFSLHGQGANTYAWFMDENDYYGNDTAKVGDQISFEAATDEVLVMSGTLNGCTDTIHVPLSVQTPPILHTEGLKPICQGEVLELIAKATNVNEEDKVEFSWSAGSVSGELGDTMRMTPLSTQEIYLTGWVVLLDENGEQIYCKNTLEIPVTVNTKPTIEVEGERTVCYGTEAKFTAVGAAAYEWVELESSSETVRPIITSDTTLTVRGKDTGTGCDAEAVVKVKVKPLPVLGVANGSKVILCDGEEADITVFGAATYGWRQPDGSLVAGNRYKHTPEQDTIYRVIGTSNNNCVDSMDIEVTVNMLPSLSYSGDSEICSGDSLILFGHSAPEGCTFSWSNGDKGDKMEAKPLVSATYTLTGEDGNGCVTSMEIPVVVNQRTPLNLAGTSNVCAGSQAEVYVVDAEGFTAFNWSNGNVGENIKPHVSEKTTFTAEGIDVNGCVTKAEFTVNVTEIPVLSFHGDTVVCLGDEVSLLADGAGKYNWRDVDGNLLSDKARYTFKPDVETKLILEGYMSNCKAEREIPIMVNAVPNLEVDMPEFICRGSVGELRATAGAGVTFEWSTGETEKVIEVAPLKSTTYTVTATNKYGCDSSVTRVVLVVEPPKVLMGTSKDMVCPDQADSVYFSATGANTYTWSSVPAVADINIYNFDKNAFWAVLDEGEDVEVTVVGTDEKGCETKVTKTIAQRELEPMQFVINPNCIDAANPEVRFSGKVPDHEDAVWTWTPGEGLDPVTPSSETKGTLVYKYELPLKDSFEVKVRSVDEHGCIQDGSGWVYKWRDFWAAEAFTPDGDGLNDVFRFHGGDFIENFTYIIYNRMGEVIFEGNSIEDEWDGNYKGEPCPTGVYGWTVRYDNNSTTLSKSGERKGMVTIVR